MIYKHELGSQVTPCEGHKNNVGYTLGGDCLLK